MASGGGGGPSKAAGRPKSAQARDKFATMFGTLKRGCKNERYRREQRQKFRNDFNKGILETLPLSVTRK